MTVETVYTCDHCGETIAESDNVYHVPQRQDRQYHPKCWRVVLARMDGE